MTLDIKRISKITSAILIIFIIILISLAYFGYLDLKKTLVVKISDKATSIIGQRIDIGDLSFSPSAGINLHNISIKNPKGFESGQLLQIKRLYFKIKFSELFRGRLYFKNIIAYSPELTLMKDKNGRLNISEKLVLLLTKKPALKYQVDEFNIYSGIVDFNKDERYRNDNINLHLKNLSSDPGTKTLIKGRTSCAEGNRIKIDGWAYFKDEPKKFNISISSEDFALSAFREVFNRYKINADRTKINMSFHVGGDIGRGFDFKSKIQIKGAGSIFFNKEIKDILLNTDVFFNIRDNSILINDFSFYAGNVASVRSSAIITDILKNPYYSAELKIDRIDLSAFNFIKDLKASGIMTSDNISVKGKFKNTMPKISGTVKLRDAAVKSNNTDIEKINAKLELSSDREISVKAEATAKILKVWEYFLDRPADIWLLLTTQGRPERIDGTIKDMVFSGINSFEIKGIRYGNYHINRLNSRFNIDYRKNVIAIKNLEIDTEDLKSSAGQINIRIPRGKAGCAIEIKDVNAAYPAKEAELNNFDFHINLNAGGKRISGDFDFSGRKTIFQGINSGLISGSGRFDEKEFYINIPRVEVSGGRIKLAINGKTTEDLFPIKINARVEDIDIGVISKAASRFSKIPYNITGDIKMAALDGTIDSADSLHGNASVQARKISVLKIDNKRNILKDVFLNNEIEFKGKDFKFKADANAGKISTKISGTIKRFMQKDRSVEMKATLPEVKVTDIRDSFWDTFPDSLLYTGLYGYISSDVSIDYSKSGLKVNGELMLKDFVLVGENNEYSAGPINGIVPIAYGKTDDKQKTMKMPSFERSEFDNLSKYYSQKPLEDGFSKITIGSLSYGYRFLENINVWIKQNGSVLNIGRFSGNIFGGRLDGSADGESNNKDQQGPGKRGKS